MPATPNITLTATLDDLSGNQIGTTANPAKIRVTLCGFGPTLPRIAGAAMIAQPGPITTSYLGTAASIKLWGNDQITPSGTFYTVELLDGNDNVVQCGAYQFTGGPLTIDLSNALQILPPYGFSLGGLAVRDVTGTYPGTVYTAAGLIIAVFLNGQLLDPNASPTPDYTLSVNRTVITLSFTTSSTDKVTVLSVQ